MVKVAAADVIGLAHSLTHSLTQTRLRLDLESSENNAEKGKIYKNRTTTTAAAAAVAGVRLSERENTAAQRP